MSAWLWLLVAVGFGIVEVTNLALFALFAAVGAVAAAVASGAGGGPLAQTVVFAAVSVGGVALVRRPVVRALGPRRGRALRSGVAGLVGQHGTVVSRVAGDKVPGAVHVRGEDWPAISYDDRAYEPGELVEVLDIESTRLVVTAG